MSGVDSLFELEMEGGFFTVSCFGRSEPVKLERGVEGFGVGEMVIPFCL